MPDIWYFFFSSTFIHTTAKSMMCDLLKYEWKQVRGEKNLLNNWIIE